MLNLQKIFNAKGDKMKQVNAFTMVELIFVIVILGILAAVAIPRLVATRTDAIVTAKLQNLAVFITDVSAYYTAKGQFSVISNMSQTKDFSSVDLAKDPSNAISTIINFQTPLNSSTENCVQLEFKDGNITLTKANTTPAGNVCKVLVKTDAYQDLEKSHIISGSRVKH